MPVFTVEINNKVVEFTHIPKCGGTSAKCMMLEASGFDWRNSPANDWGLPISQRKHQKQNNKFMDQHGKGKFGNVDYRFTIIRDPIKRLVSCYTNRVLFYNKMRNRGWDNFVDKLGNYAAGDISHHSFPMTYWLGKDPNRYDKIFTVSQVGTDVREWLSEIANTDVPALQRQDGGREKQSKIVITEDQITRIKKYYKNDYENWWNDKVVPQEFV